MPDQRSDGLAAPLPVWRPAKAAKPAEPAETGETEVPVRVVGCGGEGPILSVDERFEQLRALKKEWDEARAREEAEAEEKEKEKASRAKPGDDEDETRMVERFRNDRYAVKLLKQTDDVWGRGDGGAGALG